MPSPILFVYVGLRSGADLAGLAILIMLIFDAISDPLIGYLSDNTLTLGRRHPFIYAHPVALTFFLIGIHRRNQ